MASVPPSALPIVETFHSLQGEGLHAGRSAFFIRLAGCSVGCSWCDTKHSWPAAAHDQRSLAALTTETLAAAGAGAAFVVITGGEPLEHDLDPLCSALARAGLPLHLETSGTAPLSGSFDWITLSPKRHRPPGPKLLVACQELKVVVHEPADLDFAEAMAEQARQRPSQSESTDSAAAAAANNPPAAAADLPTGTDSRAATAPGNAQARDQADGLSGSPIPALLLQPGWDSPQGQELAIAYVRSHPAWRLSLQGHKWLRVR